MWESSSGIGNSGCHLTRTALRRQIVVSCTDVTEARSQVKGMTLLEAERTAIEGENSSCKIWIRLRGLGELAALFLK